MRNTTFWLSAFTLVAFTGCVESAFTHHTIYLTPESEVSWTILEREVRSTDRDPAERSAEEHEYLAQAQAGEHPAAQGLRLLEPTSLEHRVLRSELPYSVYTEARFGRVDEVIRRLFVRLETPATVTLTHEEDLDRTSLTVRYDPSLAPPELPDETDPLVALFFTLEDNRIVLTQGRFVEAVGFELLDDGRVARLDGKVLEEEEEPVALRLAWSLGDG